MQWASWTIPYGWPVKGLWPEGEAVPDVQAVDRCQDGTLLATGDAHGRVRVLNYPCASEAGGAAWVSGKGHASNVTNARFTSDNEYLITVGGTDRCVLQWKVVHPHGEDDEDAGLNLLAMQGEEKKS